MSCLQAGRMAQAIVDMGFNGSLLFLDATLSETLPRAMLAATSLRAQRTAVVVWNHAFAQRLARRSWVKLLQEVQPTNVRWASVGNNLFDDRLAREIRCGKRSQCGCSDPSTGYVDCLAGVFNLVTLALHGKAESLRRTILRAELAGIHGLPAVGFANSIAGDARWMSRAPNASQIRMLVDCGGIGGHRSKEVMEQPALLNMLFAGVDKYHAAHPHGMKVNSTTFNCEDIRMNVLHRGKLKPANFDILAYYDVYATVASDPLGYAATVPEAQAAGAAVLLAGDAVGAELFEEGVTGFEAETTGDVQRALEIVESGLGSGELRVRIHEAARQRFSARRALRHILAGLFPDLAKRKQLRY